MHVLRVVKGDVAFREHEVAYPPGSLGARNEFDVPNDLKTEIYQATFFKLGKAYNER